MPTYSLSHSVFVKVNDIHMVMKINKINTMTHI
jgi:hypothetical protein